MSNIKWTPSPIFDNLPNVTDTKYLTSLTQALQRNSPDIDLYMIYEYYNDIDPKQPFFALRLANAYSQLEFYTGALQVLQNLEYVRFNDPYIQVWVAQLMELVNQQAQISNRIYDNKEYVKAPLLIPLENYVTHVPPNLNTLEKMCHDVANHTNGKKIKEAYARILSIETNEIEDVFRLSPQSKSVMTRCGFFMGAIQHVDHNQNITKNKTLNILKGTQQALDYLVEHIATVCAGGPFRLTAGLIIEIHNRTMQSNAISEDRVDEFYTRRKLVRTRSWRTEVVYVKRFDGSVYLFHHPNVIANSIEQFVHQANINIDRMLRNEVDPFTVSAWMHHTLINIHPFIDGNGRMTRFISSIPLILKNYMPLYIGLSNKKVYIDALVEADTTTSIVSLVQVFASNIEMCLEMVKANCIPKDTDEVYMTDAETGKTIYYNV